MGQEWMSFHVLHLPMGGSVQTFVSQLIPIEKPPIEKPLLLPLFILEVGCMFCVLASIR
jgi:hypothetical protein